MPAEEIHRQQNLIVVSHVDADGLTAAAIICTALERLNIDYKPLFFRQLDESALDEVADQGADLVIFTDLGSGMIQEICDRGIRAVVADHHKPAVCDGPSSGPYQSPSGGSRWRDSAQRQRNLFSSGKGSGTAHRAATMI